MLNGIFLVEIQKRSDYSSVTVYDLEPVDLSAFSLLGFRGVCPAIVLQKRLQIVPTAPVADQQGVDVGAGKRGPPGAPKSVTPVNTRGNYLELFLMI